MKKVVLPDVLESSRWAQTNRRYKLVQGTLSLTA